MLKISFIFAAVILQMSLANKLPSYINRCKISDSKFHDCVLESANNARWPIMNGDTAFGFPKLFPFKLPNLDLDLSENVNFKLTNGQAKISGDPVFTNVHFDFDQKTVVISAELPQIEWFVDYESSGQLAGKAFQETGKGNLTFDNVSVNSTFNLGFKMVDGNKYIEALSGDMKTFSEKFVFKPYNQVTRGAPMTDEQMQEYQPYFKSIRLAIRDQLQRISTELYISFLNIAFKSQPFNEIFLP